MSDTIKTQINELCNWAEIGFSRRSGQGASERKMYQDKLEKLLSLAVEGERKRCIELCHKAAVLGTYELDNKGISAIDMIIGDIKSGTPPIHHNQHTTSNCCGAKIIMPDKNGHGRCSECKEGCIGGEK